MAVNLTLDDGVAEVLIRGEDGNRLDRGILDGLLEAFENATRSGARALVLAAAGDDFCLGRSRADDPPPTEEAIAAQFTHIQSVNAALQALPMVTVAAVQGQAVGAGLSLAARCDIVLVADDARLSFPEVPHGVPPTIVLSHYGYVLPRNLLGDLIFTGREIVGGDAIAAGLAARAVAPAELMPEALSIARQVATYDPASIRLVKHFLAQAHNMPPGEAPALGIALYAEEMARRA
jgi:enoyl-CoA hydratase/carnithine racemase